MRTSSSAFICNAFVRQRQMHAAMRSNVVHCLRWDGTKPRIAAISEGPKKNDRRTMSCWFDVTAPLTVFGTCSYSRWLHVIRGGCLAMRSSLRQTGGMEGLVAPRAISVHVLVNCERPAPSHMMWLKQKAKMKPPHLRRVTCTSRRGVLVICCEAGTWNSSSWKHGNGGWRESPN
ncbi:hypothetical protein V8G54_031646 [Vigna mungo]|uniref:Uncharacterized protein n=1 Tax=Vigna mungo TaxID=3915 RepID=A0AAQ3MKT4_VIGMU